MDEKKSNIFYIVFKIKHLCIQCNLQCSFAHLTIIKQNCVTEYCNSEFNVLIHEFCMNDLYVNCNWCINALIIWICKLNRIDTRHKVCILHFWVKYFIIVALLLHTALEHLELKNTYIRILFID